MNGARVGWQWTRRRPRGVACRALAARSRFVELGQNVERAFVILPPDLRQAHLARGAVQEPRAQSILKLLAELRLNTDNAASTLPSRAA
jgi:hypothetical protein